jgi:hypothetical protein
MVSLYFLLAASTVAGDLVNLRSMFGLHGPSGIGGGGSLMQQAAPTSPDGVIACYVRGKDLRLFRDWCSNDQVRFQTIPRQEFTTCSEIRPFASAISSYSDLSEVRRERGSKVSVFFTDCSHAQGLPALRSDEQTDFVFFVYFDGKLGHAGGFFRTPVAFFSIAEAEQRHDKIQAALNKLASATTLAKRLTAFTDAAVNGGASTAVKIGTVGVVAMV